MKDKYKSKIIISISGAVIGLSVHILKEKVMVLNSRMNISCLRLSI